MTRPVLAAVLLGCAGSAGAQTYSAPAEVRLSVETASPLATFSIASFKAATLSMPTAATPLTPTVVPTLAPTALGQVRPAPSVSSHFAKVRAVFKSAADWLTPKEERPDPAVQVPWSFKLKDKDFYYHGTTLADLTRTVDSGGDMEPGVSQYSIRSSDSIMYGKNRRAKLGDADNPAVLLQFRYDDLKPLVSADAFKDDVLAAAQMSYFSLHSAYAAADKPVPLSLMTPESKESLLAWLRVHRPDLLEKFERALSK